MSSIYLKVKHLSLNRGIQFWVERQFLQLLISCDDLRMETGVVPEFSDRPQFPIWICSAGCMETQL